MFSTASMALLVNIDTFSLPRPILLTANSRVPPGKAQRKMLSSKPPSREVVFVGAQMLPHMPTPAGKVFHLTRDISPTTQYSTEKRNGCCKIAAAEYRFVYCSSPH